MNSFKPVSVILRNDFSQSDDSGIDKTFQDLLNACRSGDLERVERELLQDYKFSKAVDESQYFANKLETTWRNYEIIEITEPQWHPTCFRGILRYLYTGEIVTIAKDLENKMILLSQHFELDNLAERYKADNQISKKEVQVLDKLESQELRQDFEKFFKNVVLRSADISNNEEIQRFAQADI
ncbi:3326_t:CDS:2, partial [Racocetra fulgida]